MVETHLLMTAVFSWKPALCRAEIAFTAARFVGPEFPADKILENTGERGKDSPHAGV
jgi:hypothetical protein